MDTDHLVQLRDIFVRIRRILVEPEQRGDFLVLRRQGIIVLEGMHFLPLVTNENVVRAETFTVASVKPGKVASPFLPKKSLDFCAVDGVDGKVQLSSRP